MVATGTRNHGGMGFGKARHKFLLLVTLASVLTASLARPALAAGGDLDPTFSTNGKIRTDFTPSMEFAYDLAIQADGKIVAVGNARRRFALVRYTADGTLDSTFGGDGKVRTNFTTETDHAEGVAIQANGKIVAVGVARSVFSNSDSRFAVARYNADGTLDATFGGDGKVTTSFRDGDDHAQGVAIQANGKIVAVGTAPERASGVPEDTRFALARYNAKGELDSTFGGDGKVTSDFEEGWGEALGVAIQADGKIVAVGYEGYGDSGAVARYNSDGSLDSTFGGAAFPFHDGYVTTDNWVANGVAIQADGKVVVSAAGWGSNWVGPRWAVFRFNANGTKDATFGEDGRVTTSFTLADDYARGLAIQADGKIVVAGGAGSSGSGSDSKFAVARYIADGSLDSTFGGDGKVTTNFTTGVDAARGVVIQADGKIVAAGGANGRFALARYLAE